MDTLTRLAGHIPDAAILLAAVAMVAYFVGALVVRRRRWLFNVGGASVGMALVMLAAVLIWSRSRAGPVIAATWVGVAFAAVGVVLLNLSRWMGNDPELVQEGCDPTVETLGVAERDAKRERLR